MKRILFVLLSVISLLSIAGKIQTNADQDPKAKAILDELSKKSKTYTSIKADFTLSLETKDQKKESQTGKIQIKGDKFKLDIKGQEIICDGKTIWTYLKEANEVQISNKEAKVSEELNPATVFTLYEKGYKYKFDKEEVKGKVTTQIISLFPMNPDKKKFHTVKLYIDKTKKQITSAVFLMKDGSKQSIVITSFTPNTPLADTFFSFDAKAHPGVEVMDLRDDK